MSKTPTGRLMAGRMKAVKYYKLLAILMTGCSILSMCLGIAILSFSSGAGFPIKSGAPIWSAAIVLIGAVFGLLLGKSSSEWKTESDRKKQRCLVILFYVFAVTSFSFCGLCMGYSIWGAIACGNKIESTCGRKFDTLVILNICTAICTIVLFIMCLVVTVMFCVYRRYFQFYGKQDQMAMMMQMQQTIMQQQTQLASQGQQLQQVQQTQRQQPTPYHYSQQGYGTQWSSPPPSYTDVKSNRFSQ